MTSEQERPATGQASRGTRAKFWIGVAVVVAVAVVSVVFTVQLVTDDRDERLEQLNRRYVEEIEFRSESAGGSTTRLIVIDGVTRRDCEEEGGVLSCSEDPQPTRE